jgi:hypothetical protein
VRARHAAARWRGRDAGHTREPPGPSTSSRACVPSRTRPAGPRPADLGAATLFGLLVAAGTRIGPSW